MTDWHIAYNKSIDRFDQLGIQDVFHHDFFLPFIKGGIVVVMRVKGKTYVDVVEPESDTRGLYKTLCERLSE